MESGNEAETKARNLETQVETSPNSGTRKQEPEVKAGFEFLFDGPEQIAESMKKLGPLRDELYEVFREAIDRVNKGQSESDRPGSIYETTEGKSEDEAPLK